MIWASVVRVIHIAIVLAIIICPFIVTGVNLTLYVVIIPFIVLHWYTNNNTCALTTLERAIRRRSNPDSENVEPEEKEECFTCDLIEPVYDVHKNMPSFSSNGIYIITLMLWLFAAARLRTAYQDGGYLALLEP